MRFVVLTFAALLLSGCASLGNLHAAHHCGHGGDSAWSIAEAPANADAYRAIARATPDPDAARASGREYWFTRGDVTKFCLIDARPATCETLRGVWWEFTQTDGGLSAGPASYGVCVL